MNLILMQLAMGSFVYLLTNACLLHKDSSGLTYTDRAYAFFSEKYLRVNRYFFDWLTLVVTPTGLAVGTGLLVPIIAIN